MLARALGGLGAWLALSGVARAQTQGDNGGTDLPNALQHQLGLIRTRIIELVEAIKTLPEQIDRALLLWSLEFEGGESLLILLYIVLFVVAGFAAQWAFWRVTREARLRIVHAPAYRFADRLRVLTMRLVFNALALGFFILGSVGAFLVFTWPPLVKLVVLTYLSAFVAFSAAYIVSSMLLGPRTAKLRLVPIDDGLALALHRWLIAATLVVAFGLLTASLMPVFGFAHGSVTALRLATGLTLAVMAIVGVWRLRPRIAGVLRGDGAATSAETAPPAQFARQMLIDLWPHGATLYIALLWASWALGSFRIAGTLLILGLTMVARMVLRAMAYGRFGPTPTDADSKIDRPFAPVVARFTGMLTVVVALLALAVTWDIGIDGLFSGGDNAPIFRAVFNIVVALLLADAIWHLARTAIDVNLARQVDGGATHARLATLLPLARKALLVSLLVVVGMIVLSAIGVDIGPLLAGAGVLGIAIGFGAQTLVKDIVSGVFFLIDDAFRVGEYVEIGDLKGTVEAISIRSLRLRHHRGPVHTIPFGEMRALTNYSRDWVIDKFQFGVTYDSDLDKVKKIIKQIGKDLLADPEHGPKFLEPLKSQGVEKLGDFAIDIRVKFKVRPGDQFTLRREAFKRIKKAFDANGIKFAFPTVSVQGGGEAAAAQAALQKLAQREEAAE